MGLHRTEMPRQYGLWRTLVAIAAVLAALTPSDARAQGAKSAALAKQLVQLMAQRGLDAFAAEDSKRPGHFVAARSYPGVQLLLVGARSTSADYMHWQIEHKNFGEAYSALHASAALETKLFFQDMGCDGLAREGGQVDILYERGVDQVVFGGKDRPRDSAKRDYTSKYEAADDKYSDLLQVLIAGFNVEASPKTP